ncbi:MBL fold metallo-hydrolase [Roseobacter weihaiensis]|uniref:MBL fold metallo-hydrolase n=1 Tax=Roseobacter weihaiensis TaxID=2763262 RepID=UPI001D0AA0C5|nr:MBL fold metallo-hydrolase [Roseobacter sp. H9]
MVPPDDFNPPIGAAEQIAPGLRRIVAPNPSPMTYRGTNTYLLGTTEIAVIDPGPSDQTHLAAILAAVTPAQKITHILVSHTHLDHSPLAAPLSAATGAPVLAFGTATAGRSAIMRDLVRQGLTSGGEGIDTGFVPHITLADGERLRSADWTLEVLHTPGHLGNHICLAWEDACFTADHVMGWASSLVSPPDGDLTDFMAACRRLQARRWGVFYPGHGAPIDSPHTRLDWLIAHRLKRESAILETLSKGPGTAADLTSCIYLDIPKGLLPAATRNVLAHLIDLHGKSMVQTTAGIEIDAVFGLREHC